jgi:hypothetical protein
MGRDSCERLFIEVTKKRTKIYRARKWVIEEFVNVYAHSPSISFGESANQEVPHRHFVALEWQTGSEDTDFFVLLRKGDCVVG